MARTSYTLLGTPGLTLIRYTVIADTSANKYGCKNRAAILLAFKIVEKNAYWQRREQPLSVVRCQK
jgi:hypothetical protein